MQKFSELPDIQFPRPSNKEDQSYEDQSNNKIGTLGLFYKDKKDEKIKCYTRGDNNCFAYAFATSMFLKIATLSDKKKAISFVDKFIDKFPASFTLDFGEKILKGEITKEDANHEALKKEFITVLNKFKEYLGRNPNQAALYIHQQMMQNQKFSLAIAAMVKQITLDELKLNKKNSENLWYFDSLKGDLKENEKNKYSNLYQYIQDFKIIGKLDTVGALLHIFRNKMEFLDFIVHRTYEPVEYQNNAPDDNILKFCIDHQSGHFSAALPDSIEDNNVKLLKEDALDIYNDSLTFNWTSNELKYNNKELDRLSFDIGNDNGSKKIIITDQTDHTTMDADHSKLDEIIKLLNYAGRDEDINNLRSMFGQQQKIQEDVKDLTSLNIVKFINNYCYPNNL